MSKTKTAELTTHQRAVLEHALDHAQGRVKWFPETIKGGARTKLLESLQSRGLVRERGKGWVTTKTAAQALGREEALPVETPKRGPRANSKQATVLDMLKRPEGATNGQIQAATEWQPHTVRGFIAGTVRKRLGLTVTTERDEAGDTVYRIK